MAAGAVTSAAEGGGGAGWRVVGAAVGGAAVVDGTAVVGEVAGTAVVGETVVGAFVEVAEAAVVAVVEVALRAVSSLLQPTAISITAQHTHRSTSPWCGRWPPTSRTVALMPPAVPSEDQLYVSIAAVAAARYPPPNLIACTTSGAIWCNATRPAHPSARGNTSS